MCDGMGYLYLYFHSYLYLCICLFSLVFMPVFVFGAAQLTSCHQGGSVWVRAEPTWPAQAATIRPPRCQVPGHSSYCGCVPRLFVIVLFLLVSIFVFVFDTAQLTSCHQGGCVPLDPHEQWARACQAILPILPKPQSSPMPATSSASTANQPRLFASDEPVSKWLLVIFSDIEVSTWFWRRINLGRNSGVAVLVGI